MFPTLSFSSLSSNRSLLLVVMLLSMILLTIWIDYLYTFFQGTRFYISESLLFSTYWFLYLPFVALLTYLKKKILKKNQYVLLTTMVIALHLLTYPMLVWGLSAALFSHTFSYLPTLQYALSAYFITSLVIYSFGTAFLHFFHQQRLNNKRSAFRETNFLQSLTVSINQQKKVIPVHEIAYFSANPPYINLHHSTKIYLFTGTLKSLEEQLDPNEFIRVHKSTIVNRSMILSFQSRHNGDYDIHLSEGSCLRLSRNYVRKFHSSFTPFHRLSLK